MSRAVVIYGAGGHGKVVADAALAGGWSVLGFADDDPDKADAEVAALPVLAIGRADLISLCRRRGAAVICAVGDNAGRRAQQQALAGAGLELATVVHPAAVVARSARLGPGAVLLAGAIVNPDAEIGPGAIVNTAASIDHDNRIGAFAHVSPGAHTGGTVVVGTGTHVGIGAAVRNDITIGAWSIIGAGAVVVADIPDRVVAYGNPARVVRARDGAGT
ncbi:NeuD/PglB/VioB family sugar acetyltransferase [Haliangium sp.]|uniref:NeuD/PglB/VioB family sugar acetyltransferase n=1 Tax=Haliangium sp. TaxID=2663208 RepID=UPI003D0B03EB